MEHSNCKCDICGNMCSPDQMHNIYIITKSHVCVSCMSKCVYEHCVDCDIICLMNDPDECIWHAIKEHVCGEICATVYSEYIIVNESIDETFNGVSCDVCFKPVCCDCCIKYEGDQYCRNCGKNYN